MPDRDQKDKEFLARMKGVQDRLEALSMESGRPLDPDEAKKPRPKPEKSKPLEPSALVASLHENIVAMQDELILLRGAPPKTQTPEVRTVAPAPAPAAIAGSRREDGEGAVREAPSGGGRGAIGLAIVLVCAVAGLWAYQNAGSEFALPFNHPAALAWRGDALWVADWFEPAVYRFEKTPSGLKSVKRYPLDDVHVMALAVTDKHLYLADPWTRRIERRSLDDDLTLEVSVPSPGPSPSALHFDGKHLWSADKDERRVYRHALDDELTVRKSFQVRHAPSGIFLDDDRFWTSASESGELFRHDPVSGTLLGAYDLSKFVDEQVPLAAFTWKGRDIWLAWDGADALVVRPWWRLPRKPRSAP